MFLTSTAALLWLPYDVRDEKLPVARWSAKKTGKIKCAALGSSGSRVLPTQNLLAVTTVRRNLYINNDTVAHMVHDPQTPWMVM